MKNFIVYEESGKILRTGVCSDDDFLLQGQNVLEGLADYESQYIQNGEVVNMPPKPEGQAYFDYQTKQWVPDVNAQEYVVKIKRNSLLVNSDWTQLPDVVLSNKTQWAAYRQELRDVTSQSGYPFNVIWPTPPQG